MSATVRCFVCQAEDLSPINTYKHIWYSCTTCGNISRRRKPRYALSWVPNFVFRLLPKGAILREVFKHKPVEEDFYAYYLDSESGHRPNPRGTKWHGQLDALVGELGAWGVSLRDKKILDISGGPGFLAQELRAAARRVVVTEYNQVVVDRMRHQLGVEAVRYDFNNDDIRAQIQDDFDVILVRDCVNFCLDIGSFSQSLKTVTHSGSFVYLTFALPTIGDCLRWQFDDYTHWILYGPETMARIFAEQDFVTVGRKEIARIGLFSGSFHRKVAPLLQAYYLLNRLKNCNQDSDQRVFSMLFRRR